MVVDGSDGRLAALCQQRVVEADDGQLFGDGQPLGFRIFYCTGCQHIVGGQHSVEGDALVVQFI